MQTRSRACLNLPCDGVVSDQRACSIAACGCNANTRICEYVSRKCWEHKHVYQGAEEQTMALLTHILML
jgi:hypothetical protein